MCRHARVADRITKRISGNTVALEDPVVFEFRLGRGRDGPKRFLGQFEGILQTDGYSAYDQTVGREWYTPLVGLMPEDSSSKQCN